MRASRLPALKTLADFDFSFQPAIKREQIDALLDRLPHRCHIVNIRGNSYRMRHHAEFSKAHPPRRRPRHLPTSSDRLMTAAPVRAGLPRVF